MDPAMRHDYARRSWGNAGGSQPVEAKAIDKIFENNNKKVNVSSTKSQIGHLLGAAGSVEAIYSIMCIENNKAPFTLNLENGIKTNNINFIKNEPLELNLNNILSNSFGFGGTNVSLILSKFDDKI